MFEVLKARRAEARLRVIQAEFIEQIYGTYAGRDGKAEMEDPDAARWILMGDTEYKSLEAADQQKLRANAIQTYYQSPHGRNIIRLFEKYVVGRGFMIQPKSMLEEVQAYWDAFWRINRMELRKKEIVRRTMRDGEVFIRCFKSQNDEGLTVLIVRFMNPALITNPVQRDGDADNIKDGIETNPDDIEDVRAYWYKNQRVPADEVIHIKILVDSDVRRGRSYLEPIIKKIRQFGDWLDNRIKLNRIRAVVGLIRKVLGTPTQTANVAEKYQTQTKLNPDGTTKVRAPEGVSLFTTNQGVDYEFKTPNLQASDVQHDGRNILLAIAAGAGMPEYMVSSDSSNANYASTMIAEAPGVKEFEDWQDLFGEYFKILYTKVVKTGIEADLIPEQEDKIVYEEEEVEVDVADDPFRANQLRVADNLPPGDAAATEDDIEGQAEPTVHKEKKVVVKERVEKVPTNTDCVVVFPELVHRDIKGETESYQIQYDLEIISKHTMAARLDLDYEEEQELIAREDKEFTPGDSTQSDEDYVAQRDDETHAGPPDSQKEPRTE